MMARSKCSNQRPDTLMQDRSPPAWRNPLATHGRTIHWVNRHPGGRHQAPPDVGYAPIWNKFRIANLMTQKSNQPRQKFLQSKIAANVLGIYNLTSTWRY